MSYVVLKWRREQSPVRIRWFSAQPKLLTEEQADPLISTINGLPSAGGAISAYYEHQQVSAQPSWVIPHNLGKYPDVSVMDLLGEVILANVSHLDTNVVQIDFSAPTAGRAICTA